MCVLLLLRVDTSVSVWWPWWLYAQVCVLMHCSAPVRRAYIKLVRYRQTVSHLLMVIDSRSI